MWMFVQQYTISSARVLRLLNGRLIADRKILNLQGLAVVFRAFATVRAAASSSISLYPYREKGKFPSGIIAEAVCV
jgi:hypothetical protein